MVPHWAFLLVCSKPGVQSEFSRKENSVCRFQVFISNFFIQHPLLITVVEKGAGFLATSTTDVYERQRMLAPLHLILCRHFQAFVLFDILCASYHIAGTRKLQLWELGMLEELNRQRGRDQTSHYTHPRAREDSQVLPFATQQHSSHQVYHHLEQMGLFAKPAENKYFFLAWG